MSIGDVHSQDRGSGARFNDGKVALDLVPLSALEDCARVFDYGRRKYAAWNWAKGMEWSVPYGCLLRHIAAWFNGEDNDPESGLPHLGHAMCNLVMLSTFARTYREGDDRPKEWLAGDDLAAYKQVAEAMVTLRPFTAEEWAMLDGEPTATGGGMATHYVEPPEAPDLTPEQAAFVEAVESREAATPADMGLNVDVEGRP